MDTNSPSPPAKQESARRGRPRRQDTITISFRVDATRLKALERGASASGLSAHEYARLLTYQALDHLEEVQFAEEMAQTRNELSYLREDLAASLEVILTNTTRGDANQIRAWIDTNLRQKR